MKQVTVFGGSGFIGRHLVRRLAEQGCIVRVAVRDAAGANFLRPMGDVGQVTPVMTNIRDDAAVAAAVRDADAVVNLVGILFESGRQTFEAVHRDAAARIARHAKAAGVDRLVQISALGASTRSPSRYAWSKAAGEEAVLAEFPGATILRPSVVFGPQDEFFNRFAAMARMLPVLPVFGGACPIYGRANAGPDDDGNRFQPVYVGNVADAIMAGLTRDDTAGKIYELGGPTVYSFRALMELVLRQTDRRCLLLPVPFWFAGLMAAFLQYLPKPPLTPDQVTLLRTDNVVTGELPGLDALDIAPTAAEVILPTYLDRFRRGGRFHAAVRA
ncbi:MAG: complex I NDUFA9 subunit family protein [Alphaproteobacteria bacterium]